MGVTSLPLTPTLSHGGERENKEMDYIRVRNDRHGEVTLAAFKGTTPLPITDY